MTFDAESLALFLPFIPVAAIISALVTLTIRHFDKPRPHLVIETQSTLLPVSQENMRDLLGQPTILRNIGDGTAYDLRIAGSDCVVGVRLPRQHQFGGELWASEIAKLDAGASLLLDVQEDGDRALILVTHARFPSTPWLRWARKSYSRRIDRALPDNPLPPGAFSAVRIPWLMRRLGAARRYGLQGRTAKPDRLREDRDEIREAATETLPQ